MSKFGNALREARKRKELYLKDVASFMNWSVAYLSDIERGNRKPPAKKNIERLCVFLGMGQEEMLNNAGADRGYIELNLKMLNPVKTKTALSFAQKIEHLNDTEVQEIDAILQKSHVSKAHRRKPGKGGDGLWL